MGPVLLFVKICMLLSVAYSGGICYTRRTISFIPIFMSEQYDLLKSILLEKSVRTGTFTLASGKVSDLYVDCRMTALDLSLIHICSAAMRNPSFKNWGCITG